MLVGFLAYREALVAQLLDESSYPGLTFGVRTPLAQELQHPLRIRFDTVPLQDFGGAYDFRLSCVSENGEQQEQGYENCFQSVKRAHRTRLSESQG